MFERLWEIDMKQCVDAAPVLDGQNTAYIGSHSGKVCAINVMNGEELWSISLPNRVEACCALNSGESWLAVGCHDGFLYVLDCPTGIQLSKFKTRGEIKSAAVLNGADIWFGSYDHSIYCVWYGNGKCKEKFRFYVGQNIFAKPLLHEGYVIFAGTKGDVICIDAAKHCLKWHQKVDTKAFFSSPVAAADAIVIIGIYGTVYRIHLESGSTVSFVFYSYSM
jgi:acyl-CoA synthetase